MCAINYTSAHTNLSLVWLYTTLDDGEPALHDAMEEDESTHSSSTANSITRTLELPYTRSGGIPQNRVYWCQVCARQDGCHTNLSTLLPVMSNMITITTSDSGQNECPSGVQTVDQTRCVIATTTSCEHKSLTIVCSTIPLYYSEWTINLYCYQPDRQLCSKQPQPIPLSCYHQPALSAIHYYHQPALSAIHYYHH